MKSILFYVLALGMMLTIIPAYGENEKTEFFVIWGSEGTWESTLTINDGQFFQVEPYMFLGEKDRIQEIKPQKIVCASTTPGSVDGLHIIGEINKNSTFSFTSNRFSQDFNLNELPPQGYSVFRKGENEFLIIGKGNPGVGPQYEIEQSLGKVFKSPVPKNPVALPDNWKENGKQVKIYLSQKQKKGLQIRRCSNEDGKLYLEIYNPTDDLKGKARIEYSGSTLGNTDIDKSLWLSLKPSIDTLLIQVSTPSETKNLKVATTLVETRKSKLFVNGEPFLVKGVLSGSLTPEDARYIKSLGINTLRGGVVTEDAERYGFMVSASIQGGGLKKISDYVQRDNPKEFEEHLKNFLANTINKGTPAFHSPNTLVIQLDNERTEIGANTLNTENGADPWSEFFQGDKSEFNILNGILVREWNLIKPLMPMLPLGYANESLGYIAPGFLDVIMHNTYLEKDRYGVPLKTFMKWQGCDNRPFINTEFGANRYIPESYHGAKNSPVLEKLHAWNFKELWETYMNAGTMGGTIYRLYDGDHSQAIQGTLNFGIMTLDKQPKLACWELMHLWRDFEIEPISGNRLLIAYKRDYWARNCQLILEGNGQNKKIMLGDFSPNSKQVIEISEAFSSFHWKIDYNTHQGLPMLASGTWPYEVEKEYFVQNLRGRDTYGFLKELFDTRVVTVNGHDAPPTFAELQQPDGVIPVAFQKPDGVVYVAAFARIDPNKDYKIIADIHTSFSGEVVAVDEWTGNPMNSDVQFEQTSKGITIKNVTIPVIPGPIGQRSDEPVVIPIFRITPFNSDNN